MKEIIDITIKASKERTQANQGDYIGADDLLMCGKCHTPKQGKYEMPWGPVTPFIPCKCEQEQKEKEQAEREALKRKERIARNRQKAFPEADMTNCTFENDDGKNAIIGNIARNYVENFETMLEKAKGLVFFGDVGTGKTFFAACIANALLDKGYPVMMLDIDRIINTLQGSWDGRQEYLDSFHRCPLLVVDDLGMESKSEYVQQKVFSIIDARCKAKLPLVVTTNLTSEQLKNPKDIDSRRIYSRLLEMCMPIEVKGPDKRREKCRDSFEELRGILGL